MRQAKGVSPFTVRIDNNEVYRLRMGTQELAFTEIFQVSDANTVFPVERCFGKDVERVGEMRLRDLLLLPAAYNPLWTALREVRGVDYTWRDFTDARKKKYDL